MGFFKKVYSAVMLLFFFLLFNNICQAQDIQSLIKSENDFNRSALEDGIKKAFLKVLTDSSISFRPLPVIGKAHLLQGAGDNGVLSWKPDLFMVSSQGDYGFTSGPYEYRRHGDQSEIIAYGHYLSVWKNVGGRWKLFADIGAPHEKCDDFAIQTETLKPQKFKTKKESAKEHLLNFDKDFSQKCSEGKMEKYFTKMAIHNVRIITGGKIPFEGKGKLKDYIRFVGQPINAIPQSAFVSVAGDFGFTYGTIEIPTAKGENGKTGYVRVWKRKSNKKWALVAQATNSAVKD